MRTDYYTRTHGTFAFGTFKNGSFFDMVDSIFFFLTRREGKPRKNGLFVNNARVPLLQLLQSSRRLDNLDGNRRIFFTVRQKKKRSKSPFIRVHFRF